MQRNRAWMRVLTVVLTSTKLKKSFTFGANYSVGKEDLSITCNITKCMSSLKDRATIHIDNLTYNEITQLITGEFYDVQIWAGYRQGNVNKVFSGGVLYMSNKLNSDRTNTLIILCASNIVAKYGQSRLNLTLNSGINMYSAISYICKQAGINNSNVSEELKTEFLDKVMNVDESIGNWLDKLCTQNDKYIVNVDESLESAISIFDSAKSNGRVLSLTNNDILLTGGYPRLTSDGLALNMLPTFNFVCGDVIKIDNAILDVSISDENEISKNYAAYFSEKGEYMITELEYTLSNRSQTFNLSLKCKNRDRISSYVGK